MDPETSDTVTDWEPVAAGSGLTGLESLVADEFCGAVTDGTAWAFLLNGRIVGVFDGSLDAFEGVDLTGYRAPDPALPLLFAMRERGGEVRGQYYTQKTPLSEVHQTLSSGSFTGYVELSENVLSGDYYVVYHGGRSMNVAFVGASERLVTGDEAFDLAADEVGIYTVTAVDVEVVDLPDGVSSGAHSTGRTAGTESADTEPTASADDAADVTFDPPSASASDSAESATDTDADAGSDTDADTDTDAGSDTDTDTDTDSPDRRDDTPRRRASDDLRGDMGIGLDVGDDPVSDPAEESERAAEEPEAEPADSDSSTADGTLDAASAADDPDDASADVDSDADFDEGDAETAADVDSDADDPEIDGEPGLDADADADPEDGATADSGAEVGTEGIDTEVTNGRGRSASERPAEPTAERAAEPTPDESDQSGDAGETAERNGGTFTAERQPRSTRRVPALAPEESMDADESAAATDEDPHSTTAEEPEDPEEPDASTTRDADVEAETGDPEPAAADTDGASADPTDATAELATRLERAVDERDELAAEVERLESRLQTVTGERDELRSRLADLESEVERLREAVAAAEAAESTASGAGGHQLSPAAARDGTNLFVRYRTKGKPTLSKARTGDAAQEDVVDNLRLEYHTTFDSEATTVAGDPYETFLHDTVEWAFVTWVVEDLLYEIGRAGYRTELAPLFDAIPEIDRIQFDGEVPVTVQENGTDSHESRTFDLVFWNSMGDPLFVVDVDTDRNATTQSMVGSLIEGARAVGTSKGTLSGAFYVSNSFFDPGALDAVGEETKSGLLRRGSKKSFVKLSRKEGYHLCLVEARGGEFHLTVPEL